MKQTKWLISHMQPGPDVMKLSFILNSTDHEISTIVGILVYI